VTIACIPFRRCLALSSPARTSTSVVDRQEPSSPIQPVGNILILDHLNFNHEKGRHDWLKSFYFDFLKCAVDPRKAKNLEASRGTIWANIGANQFHLPEGAPDAQVLDGVVTLAYSNVSDLKDRLRNSDIRQKLDGSEFDASTEGDTLLVTDPWGTRFRLVNGDESERDTRGKQPGSTSEGLSLRDLTIYVPVKSNLPGIARFYNRILAAPVLEVGDERCVVSTGPRQTLTFIPDPQSRSTVKHDDLRDDKVVPPEGRPAFLSNYGAHISIYVADLPATYKWVDEIGMPYVNPRFKRRAYDCEEAIDDCMFRCLDIVDPDNVGGGTILRLEHEVRSVVMKDGSKYKSCPFDEIPG